MRNNWQEKLSTALVSLKDILKLTPPIVSGGASLILLREIISSNLTFDKFSIAIFVLLFLFSISAVLYYILSKLEKDKDVYLLSVVGKTIGDVFKRYGQQMAANNADNAKAEDMNKIMQTIVSLVKEMENLSDKSYKS